MFVGNLNFYVTIGQTNAALVMPIIRNNYNELLMDHLYDPNKHLLGDNWLCSKRSDHLQMNLTLLGVAQMGS